MVVHICNPSALKGAEEVTQWLRTLDALPADPSLILRSHMVANNHLLLQFQGNNLWLLWAPGIYM